MEAVAYILVLALAIGTIFFAIAFREPPRIENKEEK
ncbi:MAG: photosystem II reaction center protein T [Rivularia sp. (in: Bacteria)]|nr:photosystem II reaction center protein T [Rivularia sp. MS3]MCJ8278408.1 photosystem II reaction center protein T [Rivularia sp. ALOHA_DT_140]